MTLITPVAISSIGYRYYIVYACIGACAPILVYFYYPETMSRSLEEMEDLFKESTSIRSIVRASKRAPQVKQEEIRRAEKEKELEVEEIERSD